MRLLLISQDFPPDIGGIQTYCFELADRFYKNNEDFAVLAPKKKKDQDVDLSLPYKVHRVLSSNALLPYTSLPVIKSLTRNKYDTTFHAQWQTVLPALPNRKKGYIKRVFAAAHGRELLFNPFNNDSFAGRRYVAYRRWLLSQVDHFFAVSRYTANLLMNEGVSEDRITVMPNGTNPGEFYPTETSELRNKLDLNSKRIIMTITRLVPRKGVDNVLSAMRSVIKKYDNALYLIVGGGNDLERLESLVSEFNLNNNVRFLGKVPHSKVKSYYNLCEVFVMTPRTEPLNIEGFGIVYLEANACGKPVIGSTSGGITDAIIDGKTGLLVDEDNPEQLADAILQLLDDSKLAEKLGKQGRERVIKETNWDTIAHNIHEKMLSV
ncbi:MAG TPA: glycosyltransferase family 4 protein [Balneolales bacterium]|nr:glycosyltransferase family 4 protein [Balneolales bacterium]